MRPKHLIVFENTGKAAMMSSNAAPINFDGKMIWEKLLGHLMQTNFLRNVGLAVFLIGQVTEIFHYFSQTEIVILKMDSRELRRDTNKQTLYVVRFRDASGFLEVTF